MYAIGTHKQAALQTVWTPVSEAAGTTVVALKLPNVYSTIKVSEGPTTLDIVVLHMPERLIIS